MPMYVSRHGFAKERRIRCQENLFWREDLIYFVVQIEQLHARASSVARLLCLIRFRPSTYPCDSHPASPPAISFALSCFHSSPLCQRANPTTFIAFFSIPAMVNFCNGLRTPKPDSSLPLTLREGVAQSGRIPILALTASFHFVTLTFNLCG